MQKISMKIIIVLSFALLGFSTQIARAETASFGSDGKMFAPNCHCKEDVGAYGLASWCGAMNSCNGSSDVHSVSVAEGDYNVTVNLGGLTDYQYYEIAILNFNGTEYAIPDQGGNGSSTGTASYSLGKMHLSGTVYVSARHQFANTFTGLWYAEEFSKIGSGSALESVDVLSVVLDRVDAPSDPPPAPPTPPVDPPAPPVDPPAATAPTCAISASPTAISFGGSSTLTWSSTHTNSASINQGIGSVATNGNTSVSPTSTTTYTATVSGDGGSATCSATITVTIPSADISIVKDDNDNSNDTQAVSAGNAATFKITVTNSGNASLRDVVVTDAKVAACNRTAAQTKSLYSGDYLDSGESFSYTCVDSNVSASYTNTASVTGTSVADSTTLNDSDDSHVTVTVNEVPVTPEKSEKCNGTIGNYIWLDTNGDGVQDKGEKGLANISLKLKKDNGKLVDKTKTNKKGEYEFDNLCEGRYTVYVDDEDVAAYIQTYDPDGNKNNQVDVRLKGSHDTHSKADFGYNKTRVTPATGSGAIALYLTGLISLVILVFYKQLKQRLGQI